MQLSLHNGSASGVTVVSNIFLDYYMPRANGEFVKIYLYLLRCLTGEQADLTLASVADTFRCTETDILRALHYWEEERLLVLSGNASTQTSVDFLEPMVPEGMTVSGRGTASWSRQTDTAPQGGQASALEAGENSASSGAGKSSQEYRVSNAGEYRRTPTASRVSFPEDDAGYSGSPVSKENSGGTRFTEELSGETSTGKLSPDRVRQLKENEDIVQLLFIAEQYLGKALSPSETSRILYFYEELHFSADLVEYLIEYCVSKGSKSIRYMEKVALAWHEAGITTVSMARQETSAYHKNYFSILKAFGISNRNPVQSEINTMNHWLNDYGFTMDIITEACSRTIAQTGKVNFRYADGILSKWKQKGVRHLTDIQALDTLHRQAQADKAEQKNKKSASSNKFNNFHQRDYDFEELEKQLLNRQ